MRSLSAIQKQIVREWDAIHAKAGTRKCKLPAKPKLLGTGFKTEKGEQFQVLTAVMYMAPAGEAMLAGDMRTLCPSSTARCRATCLGVAAGMMVFSSTQNARIWKATLLLGARDLWRELLDAEIAQHERKSKRLGMISAIRVDGSTDTGEGARAANRHPGSSFYDYTKIAAKMLRFCDGNYPANYHVTYSHSGENREDCLHMLAAGGNVAVVFDTQKGRSLPATLWLHRVLDGDLTDLRFADPTGGYVIGLRMKGVRAHATNVQEAGSFCIRSSEAANTQLQGEPMGLPIHTQGDSR